jgi:hypothetical protein
MKEYGPHFNGSLSLPPEIGTNFKRDRRSRKITLDLSLANKIIYGKIVRAPDVYLEIPNGEEKNDSPDRSHFYWGLGLR